MCLIVQVPAGETLELDVIESAYSWNCDGFGLMANGEATKWKDLKPATIKRKIDELQDVDIAVHFRMATDGKVNKSNAHPFQTEEPSVADA